MNKSGILITHKMCCGILSFSVWCILKLVRTWSYKCQPMKKYMTPWSLFKCYNLFYMKSHTDTLFTFAKFIVQIETVTCCRIVEHSCCSLLLFVRRLFHLSPRWTEQDKGSFAWGTCEQFESALIGNAQMDTQIKNNFCKTDAQQCSATVESFSSFSILLNFAALPVSLLLSVPVRPQKFDVSSWAEMTNFVHSHGYQLYNNLRGEAMCTD